MEDTKKDFEPIAIKKLEKEKELAEKIKQKHEIEKEVADVKKEKQELDEKRKRLVDDIYSQRKKYDSEFQFENGRIQKIQKQIEDIEHKYIQEKEKYEGKINILGYKYEKLLKDKKQTEECIEKNSDIILQQKSDIEKLKLDYKELNTKYTNMLETYIIKV